MVLCLYIGNRNEFGKADEYEVPVTSQATIAPNFEATSLYQEVSQPYETPLSLMRNNANERNGTDNPYHILEAPSEVTGCIQCHSCCYIVMVCENTFFFFSQNKEQVYEAELYVPTGVRVVDFRIYMSVQVATLF